LCWENQRLGVMVTEPGPSEGFVFELVRDEVSSALKTIGLYQRLAEEVARREQSELAQLHKEEAIAAQVQTWVLPRDAEVQGLRIAAAMLPAPEPGGTYYDVLEGQHESFIAFGDVTGFGLGTSVIAVMLQSLITALVQCNPGGLPSDVIRGVNRALSDSLERRLSRQEQVALALIRYEPSGGIVYAGLGQEVLICRSSDGQFESVAAGDSSAGVLGQDEVTDRELMLYDGDLLMICSQGVLAARNTAGDDFGREGILRELHDLHREPVEVIREHLIEAVRAWEPQQRDDISVLIARYRAPHG
jgi:phosphoserine phosphatase RsbU/P